MTLQEAVDQLTEADRRLAGVPDSMRELHEEHQERSGRIQELTHIIETAAQERRELESKLAELITRQERYQSQISQVTTQREYGALLQEIDTTKEEISRLSAEDTEAAERQKAAESELEETRQGFAELDERYSEELREWEAEKPGIAAHAEQLRSRIEELRQKISRPLLVQYDRIATRHEGQALAPVLRLEKIGKKGPQMWHCGACNYNVRPQVVVDLAASSSLISCDSCKRILYLPPQDDAAESDDA